MNSRIENGKMSLHTRQAIIENVKSWCREEDVELDDDSKAYFFDGIKEAKPDNGDCCLSYWADDGILEYERKIYFPETDSIERLKTALIYDDKVKEYLNIEVVAEFIYNCIDVNALACVQHIALLYDEPVLNEAGEIVDWQETKGRQELMDKASDGGDEYALEIGLELLGIVWVERSAVILNIREIVDSAKEIAENLASDYYGDISEWMQEFPREFEIGLISTICHEFRHAFYELNEFTPKDGSDPKYPALGGEEDEVEEYGNCEMERLRLNPKASPYIDKMIDIKDERIIGKTSDNSFSIER